MTPLATDPQYCKYCNEAATRALIYANGRSFMAVCNQHATLARSEIHAEGSSVVDTKEIQGQRREDRELSPYERRVLSANSAPPKAALEALTGKGSTDSDASFLSALAGDWAVFRARKASSGRLDVTVDGEKFTIYMRKG